MFKDGVVDIAAEAEPFDGASGQVERGADGIFRPAGANQGFHRAPGVDGVEPLPDQVLGE